MNRRRFLELLGMATIGSAVAYSFPDIIVPKNIALVDAPEFGIISFAKLNEAYNRACIGSSKPNCMFVNKKTFDYIMEIVGPHYRFERNENYGSATRELIFRGTKIRIVEPLHDGKIISV